MSKTIEPIDPDAATFEVTITKEENDLVRKLWLMPEPLPENPLKELLKDKERLDWLLNEYGVTWGIIEYDDRITREGIDKEMTDSGYKNMREYDVED